MGFSFLQSPRVHSLARVCLLATSLSVTLGAARVEPAGSRASVLTPIVSEFAVLQSLKSGVNSDVDARSRAVQDIRSAVSGESVTGGIAYYTVSGVDQASVRRCLSAVRSRYTHADYDANTEWRIHYQYSPGRSASAISHLHVTETITITLPQLDAGATPELDHAWDTYSRNLLFHEEGHYLIDEACLAAIRARVARLPGNTPFSVVDGVCKQTMRDYSAMNEDYDHVTNHGATQGAVF